MTVRARDAAGNWSDWSGALVVTTTDTQAPTVPGGLASSAVTSTSFTLTWNTSSDNIGVTAYEVSRDGTSLGTTTGTSMSVTSLTASTAYTMTVRARDAAANWSAWSSGLVVTTASPAPAAPVITSPTSAAGTIGSAFSYTIQASGNPTSYGVVGTLPAGLALGALTTANDDHGSIAYTGSWQVSSGRQSYANYPQTDYGEDVHYTVTNGDYATFTFTGTTIKFLSETYTDEGTVDVYIDNVFDQTVNCYTATRLCRQVVYSRSNLSPGSHTIKVVKTSGGCMLVDGFVSGSANIISGTPTSAASVSVTISATNVTGTGSATLALTITPPPDTQAPTVPTGLASSSVGTNSFTLSWSASSDDVGVTAYEVMRGATSLGTTAGTSLNVTGLTPNTGYAMTVRARDAAANWSAWSSALTVTTLPADPNTDTDGDGVPDVIELQLGTNPNSPKQTDSTNQTQPNIHRPNP
jgi:chitodextrinase